MKPGERDAARAHGRRTGQRTYTPEQQLERALISAMKDWPLEPGQMLLVGPQSVARMTGQVEFDGRWPGLYILDKSEWAC